MPYDYESFDAMGLAELVRRGEASPLELVDAAIARIEAQNPALNAVVTPLFEQARAEAEKPLPDGPFKGVPFLLKDILGNIAGVRATSGSRMLADFVSGNDTYLVERYRAAGFVFVGKTNTPEFGFLPTTEPKLHGPTHNPWKRGHTPGGSSGGSAAAVAARWVPAAHANDGGGSIRIPASCCGLVGLKPTRGRTTLGPDLGDIMGGMVCEHVVTRSVRDSAAILDAVAGPAPGDPYAAPPAAGPYLEEVGRDPGKLRIAFDPRPVNGADVHPDCVAATEATAKLLVELGHEVVREALPVPGDLFTQAFVVLWAGGAAATVDGMALLTGRTATRELVEPLSWALAEMGRQRTAGEYLIASGMLQRIARAVGDFMARHDAYLTPTLSQPPVAHGHFDSPADNPLAALFTAGNFAPYTPIQNVTGEPAISLPLHWNDDGLPIGVQLVARQAGEATLFRLAAQLERARPWAHRRPAL